MPQTRRPCGRGGGGGAQGVGVPLLLTSLAHARTHACTLARTFVRTRHHGGWSSRAGSPRGSIPNIPVLRHTTTRGTNLGGGGAK